MSLQSIFTVAHYYVNLLHPHRADLSREITGDAGILAYRKIGQMGRFETEILTQPQNLKALINQPGQWGDNVHKRKSIKEIILDINSSDSPAFEKQEGSA